MVKIKNKIKEEEIKLSFFQKKTIENYLKRIKNLLIINNRKKILKIINQIDNLGVEIIDDDNNIIDIKDIESFETDKLIDIIKTTNEYLEILIGKNEN